jgi:ribose-phosphate pyrophosphokinase
MNAEPLILAGTAGAPLARLAAGQLGVRLGATLIERYAGGELHLELQEAVAGRNVFLVQPTSEPIERNLFELLLLADACRREGASSIVGVVPYLGYGRQDRRSGKAVPVGGRVVASVLATAPFERFVFLDLHAPAMEGFFRVPVDHLSAFPALTAALAAGDITSGVVVAPDAGAAKLATTVAEALKVPFALVQKTRLGGSDVVATSVAGTVRNHRPIIVDDMVTTGGSSPARLRSLPISRFLVTDSVHHPCPAGLKVETVSIASLLAEAIGRIHQERPLTDLLSRA